VRLRRYTADGRSGTSGVSRASRRDLEPLVRVAAATRSRVVGVGRCSECPLPIRTPPAAGLARPALRASLAPCSRSLRCLGAQASSTRRPRSVPPDASCGDSRRALRGPLDGSRGSGLGPSPLDRSIEDPRLRVRSDSSPAGRPSGGLGRVGIVERPAPRVGPPSACSRLPRGLPAVAPFRAEVDMVSAPASGRSGDSEWMSIRWLLAFRIDMQPVGYHECRRSDSRTPVYCYSRLPIA